MISFSKKLLFFTCLLMFSVALAKTTKKLQLIVAPNNPAFFLALNDGNGIIYGTGNPRVQGSYYVTNPFILPGGTVSKYQSDYLVDKHGNPINFDNDSIGTAYLMDVMLQTLDLITYPPVGTVIEMAQWQLQFKKECHDNLNSIFAMGFATMGILSVGTGQAAFEYDFGVTSGLGCNDNTHNNNFTAKVYLSANGQSTLIKIKFDKEIEYKD